MNVVHDLLRLVPTPEVPHTPLNQSTWAQVEHALDTQFPDDYKQLCEIYGFGQFARYIALLDYRVEGENRLATSRMKALRASQQEFPQYSLPFPIYPEPNGLLLLGQTEVNSSLFWSTDPNSEFIILSDTQDTEFYLRYDMSLSEFLLGWFLGQNRPSHFPDPEEEDEADRIDPTVDRAFYPSI